MLAENVSVPWNSQDSSTAQGKLEECIPLRKRCIEIGEKSLGPDHPDLAVWLNNQADLLRGMVSC